MRESPTAAKAYALLKKAVLKRVSIGCDDVKSKVVEIKRFHKLAPSVRFFWPPGRTRCRVNERYGDVTSTTEFARGSDSSIGQLSLPSLSMSHGRKSDDWMQKVHESQRNTVFPDTARNFGGFWGGLYRQKLNTAQSVGMLCSCRVLHRIFCQRGRPELAQRAGTILAKDFLRLWSISPALLAPFTIFSPTSLENETHEIEFHDVSNRSLTQSGVTH